jgi:hypothetical protein
MSDRCHSGRSIELICMYEACMYKGGPVCIREGTRHVFSLVGFKH